MASEAFYQAFVEIVPEAKNLRKTLAAEFDAVGPEAGRNAGKGINSGILGSVGKLAAPLAVAFAGLGIGSMLSDSISSAANLEQSVGAIDAVFKGSAAQMHDWAKTAATDVGLTQNEFNELGTLIGSQLKNGGTAMEELAPKTQSLITMGADLSSMFGGTTADAVGALSSALKGERDPIEKYGVSLNQAKIDAEAAALGFEKVDGALSSGANQAATLSLIMKQTADASGNFASEADTLSHKQQVLNAVWADGKAAIGTELLPVVSALTGAFTAKLGPALAGIATGIGVVVGGAGALKSVLVDGDFTGQFREVFHVEEDSKLVDFLFDIRDGITGVRDLVLGGDFTSAFRNAFNVEEDSPLVDFLLTMRETILGIDFAGIFGAIGSVVGPIFSQLGSAFAPLIPQIVELWQAFSPLSILLKALGPQITPLLTAVGGLATMLLGALGGALTALMPSITSLSTILVEVLSGIVVMLIPIITQLVGILGPILTTVINAVVPIIAMLAGIIGTVLEAVMPLVQAILPLLAPLLELVASILGPLIELFAAILTPVLGLVTLLVNLLIPVFSFLVTAISAVIGVIATVIQWFVDLVTGAGTAGDDLLAFFTGLPQMALDALGDLGSFLVDAGKDLMGGFIDGIKGAVGGVGDAIGGAMDWVGGFFPHSPAKRGAFSGSGWTAVKSAGTAITDQFSSGFGDVDPGLSPLLAPMVSAPSSPTLDRSVYGSASGFGGSGAAAPVVNQTINAVDGQSVEELAQIARNDLNASLRG
jgi:hypothetical protein